MGETPRQEVRRLERIMRHVERLSPAGRRWLLMRLAADNPGTAFDAWAAPVYEEDDA